MATIMSIIKDSYKVWKDTTEMFWGSNGFVYFFFIALVLVLVFDKEKLRKYTIAGYTVIVMIGLYNPVTYYLCNLMFTGRYAYFTRLYSLIPVPFLIAYAFTFLIERFERTPKLILFFMMIGIIVLGGSNVYKEDWIQKAENYSKLSNDVVEVCMTVHGYNDHVRLAAPSDLAVSIRQYDGSIYMPYGRYWGTNEPLRSQLDSDCPDVNETLKLAGDNACDFIVVKKNTANLNAFKEKGQELYDETENYYVIRLVNTPRMKYIYNKYSQIIEGRHIDSDGNLCASDNGYSVIKYEYDSRGNVIKETYYDENEEPFVLPLGYSGVGYTYDRKCRITRVYYLDQNDKPCHLRYGQCGQKKEYDSSGRVEKLIYFDENRMPLMVYSHYSIICYSYDDFGHCVSERYYDTDDKPVEIISGQYGYNKEYDENGRLATLTFVGLDNEPTMISNRYAIVRYSYDEAGNKSEERYYNDKNEPTALLDGQYGYKYTYNDKGQIESYQYLDENGDPMTLSSGLDYVACKYDDRNLLIEESYYGVDDAPLMLSSGQYGEEKTYNARNKIESVTYLDKNHNSSLTTFGYAKIGYSYDVYGNVTEERYYDENDNPVKLETGEYGQKKEYDDHNLMTKITFIDKDGNPVKTTNGYSVIKRDYNWRRYINAEYYYDKDDNPVATPEGYYGFSRESNLYDQDVSLTYMDKNHEPMEIGEKKYSNVKIYYDSDNKLASKVYYNLKGEEVNRIDYQTWDITQYSDDSNNQGLFYTLKNTVNGTLIVIDGGSTANADHVRQVINSLGGTVDAWIVTHYHEDHCGAYNAIQADPQGITIKKVYASKFDHDYEKFLEVAQYWDDAETMETWMNNSANADNVYYPDRGESITIDNLTLTFLNTYDDKLLELNDEYDLPNNCALVTLIEGNDDSMLFMSDMYSPDVGDYLKEEYGDKLKEVKYLQPCHHGNSIMPYDFYEYIDPDVIFFDAPEWLMEGDEWRAKELKEWCDEKGIVTYDYRTTPNTIEFE